MQKALVVVAFAPGHNPSGQQSAWVSPDSGPKVAVIPRRTHQTAAGPYRREYQTTARLSGGTEQARGPVYRQPNVSWHIVD